MRSSEAKCGRLVVISIFLAFVVSGCLFKQRREMIEARDAYQECVAENPETAERTCAELEAESITRTERYEEDAKRSWGCGGTSGGACDPRDRAPRIP